ncbi:hypothetical protein Ade02nite_52870 [Paractinoplanes deccanensis]|uniref:Uncharacterized protein n=1 Tax=Paractinoplanes deccanensis TaxID=113561 RepID=A0ABQ3Y9J3_9ACTN|nr:hypothetical protein Ade02nite_52870 [Actinoplanes deccanensis]
MYETAGGRSLSQAMQPAPETTNPRNRPGIADGPTTKRACETNLPWPDHSAAANNDPDGRMGTAQPGHPHSGEVPPTGRNGTPCEVEGRGWALTA